MFVLNWFFRGGALSGTGLGLAWWSLAWSFLVMPLRITSEIGAVVLGIHLRHLADRGRRSKRIFTLFAAVAVLYAAARLSIHPAMYFYYQSFTPGVGGVPSGYLRLPLAITQGSQLLLGLAFGLIGLIAMLTARRMFSRALRHQV